MPARGDKHFASVAKALHPLRSFFKMRADRAVGVYRCLPEE